MRLTVALVCSLAPGAALAQPGPYGETGDIPGCILSDSFDLHPAYPFLPIDPEDDYSYFALPDGGYVSGALGYGVVDNSAAISSPTYNGPVGGPDPKGNRGGMLHVQRASLGEDPADLGAGEAKYDLYPGYPYFATPERPLFITLDIYKPDHAAFQWVRHYGNLELMRIFGGGHHIGGLFGPLAAERGDPTLSEGLILLGTRTPDGNQAFYLAGKDIAEHSWYTIGFLFTIDDDGFARRSFWLRDQETTGEAGGPVARTPVRTAGAFAGQRMFSEFGLGIEEGWVQVYPGTEDDPATKDTIEGYGLAMGGGEEPLVPAPFHEGDSGNRVCISQRWPLYTYTRIYAGNDPTPQQVPGYQMSDWWVDNYCVRGGKRWPGNSLCRADFNVDGSIDAGDLAEMLAAWGVNQGLPGYPNQYSIDNLDNTVSSSDLAEFLATWGACP